MTKVAICGDWHSHWDFGLDVLGDIKRRHSDVAEVFHCGDFGYKYSLEFVSNLSRFLHENNMFLSFVAGNHDDYDYLENHPFAANNLRLNYMERGDTLVIGGRRFVGIGGGYSIDKDFREEYISWWRQETISYSDLVKILSLPPCDVVIAHDCPSTSNMELPYYKKDEYTAKNREALQVCVDHLEPKYLFHGHYHKRVNSVDSNGVLCVGLGSDREGIADNYVILDCTTMEVV